MVGVVNLSPPPATKEVFLFCLLFIITQRRRRCCCGRGRVTWTKPQNPKFQIFFTVIHTMEATSAITSHDLPTSSTKGEKMFPFLSRISFANHCRQPLSRGMKEKKLYRPGCAIKPLILCILAFSHFFLGLECRVVLVLLSTMRGEQARKLLKLIKVDIIISTAWILNKLC